MAFLQNLLNFIKNININTFFDIGIALVIILFFKIISPFIAYILIKMFHIREKNKNKIKQNAFYKPIKNVLLISGIYTALLIFNLPINIQLIINKVFKICIILLSAKGFSNLFNTSSENYEKFKTNFNFKGNDALFNFFTKIVKALIYIVAAFIIVNEFGYDLSGLATGLGISSVVVALAAQDLAKNIIGGFSIILDKPFDIGDYIELNNYVGTVEDITFRTTRIRDVNNQVIVIPNSKISDDYIVNTSKREKRRYSLNITLDLSTNLEKVAILNSHIKQLLANNSHVLEDTVQVYFNTISANGIDISIGFYTDIIDYNEFLRFKEEINYAILDLISGEKIELAYNSQTIYLKK